MGTALNNTEHAGRWFSLCAMDEPINEPKADSAEYATYDAAFRALTLMYKTAVKAAKCPKQHYIVLNGWSRTYDAQGDLCSWKAFSRIADKCQKVYEHFLSTYKTLYEED